MRSFFSVLLTLLVTFTAFDVSIAHADLVVDGSSRRRQAEPEPEEEAPKEVDESDTSTTPTEATENKEEKKTASCGGCAQAEQTGVPMASIVFGLFLLGGLRRKQGKDA